MLCLRFLIDQKFFAIFWILNRLSDLRYILRLTIQVDLQLLTRVLYICCALYFLTDQKAPAALQFLSISPVFRYTLRLNFWVNCHVSISLWLSGILLSLRQTFRPLSTNVGCLSSSYTLIGYFSVLPMLAMPMTTVFMSVICQLRL